MLYGSTKLIWIHNFIDVTLDPRDLVRFAELLEFIDGNMTIIRLIGHIFQHDRTDLQSVCIHIVRSIQQISNIANFGIEITRCITGTIFRHILCTNIDGSFCIGRLHGFIINNKTTVYTTFRIVSITDRYVIINTNCSILLFIMKRQILLLRFGQFKEGHQKISINGRTFFRIQIHHVSAILYGVRNQFPIDAIQIDDQRHLIFEDIRIRIDQKFKPHILIPSSGLFGHNTNLIITRAIQ